MKKYWSHNLRPYSIEITTYPFLSDGMKRVWIHHAVILKHIFTGRASLELMKLISKYFGFALFKLDLAQYYLNGKWEIFSPKGDC